MCLLHREYTTAVRLCHVVEIRHDIGAQLGPAQFPSLQMLVVDIVGVKQQSPGCALVA